MYEGSWIKFENSDNKLRISWLQHGNVSHNYILWPLFLIYNFDLDHLRWPIIVKNRVITGASFTVCCCNLEPSLISMGQAFQRYDVFVRLIKLWPWNFSFYLVSQSQCLWSLEEMCEFLNVPSIYVWNSCLNKSFPSYESLLKSWLDTKDARYQTLIFSMNKISIA